MRVGPSYISIPPNVLSDHNIVLDMDVMFVCGVPILISLLQRIRFVTVQFIPCKMVRVGLCY